MTTIQIWAILSLLSAFGVSQDTIDTVQNILVPPSPIVVTQTPMLGSAEMATSTDPVSAPAPVCIEAPVFNFTKTILDSSNIPTSTEPLVVPHGGVLYLDGSVQMNCSKAYLLYGNNGWTLNGNINEGPFKHGNAYSLGIRNNGTHGTTTQTITVKAAGQSDITTVTLLP